MGGQALTLILREWKELAELVVMRPAYHDCLGRNAIIAKVYKAQELS